VTTRPHPVFEQFPTWRGVADRGSDVNFLGVQTSISYFEMMSEAPPGELTTSYPPTDNDEIFEWIDLLESVTASNGTFSMIELGAGFGRWLANAGVACRIAGREARLVGVEAEPTHFLWMQEHLERNGVTATLIEAAVAGRDGKAPFRVGAPFDCYGQQIPRSWRERADWRRNWKGRTRRVRALSVGSIFDHAGLELADLIDLDVQGSEADVLEPAARLLDERVRRVHIGTHPGDNEERLRALFGGLGWECVHDYPCAGPSETPYGTITFQDGVQTWVNPRL